MSTRATSHEVMPPATALMYGPTKATTRLKGMVVMVAPQLVRDSRLR